MALKPYEEFANPLVFPICGREYAVPPMSYQSGLRLQRILAGDEDPETLSSESMWRLVMGAAWDDMVNDDVPLEAISRAGVAALADFQWGREAAERVWEVGIDPEALAAALAATQRKTSPNTGEANGTPSPAVTNGTKSRKAIQPHKQKARSVRS